MRQFWIEIMEEGNGVRIEVGQGTEVTGFMSRSWDNNPYNSWPPTHVAFAAWKTQVDYEFCLNEGEILTSCELILVVANVRHSLSPSH